MIPNLSLQCGRRGGGWGTLATKKGWQGHFGGSCGQGWRSWEETQPELSGSEAQGGAGSFLILQKNKQANRQKYKDKISLGGRRVLKKKHSLSRNSPVIKSAVIAEVKKLHNI